MVKHNIRKVTTLEERIKFYGKAYNWLYENAENIQQKGSYSVEPYGLMELGERLWKEKGIREDWMEAYNEGLVDIPVSDRELAAFGLYCAVWYPEYNLQESYPTLKLLVNIIQKDLQVF